MKTIKMTLTPAQMRKHTAGEPFQLTHKQLTGGSTGKHTIQKDLDESTVARLMENIQNKKGFRFPASSQGGSTFRERKQRRARNTFRKLKNTARDVGKFVAKNVPKDMIKNVAKMALDEQDIPDDYKKLIEKGVDKGIDYGYATQGKGHEDRFEFGGYKMKKQQKGVMKKGSKEAKEWGEKMRRARMAKKQGGSMEPLGGGSMEPLGGGNIWRDIGRVFKPVVPVAKEIGKDVAKDAVKDALLGAGHRCCGNNIPKCGGAMINGIPRPMISRRTNERIRTEGLIHGGSFLPLG